MELDIHVKFWGSRLVIGVWVWWVVPAIATIWYYLGTNSSHVWLGKYLLTAYLWRYQISCWCSTRKHSEHDIWSTRMNIIHIHFSTPQAKTNKARDPVATWKPIRARILMVWVNKSHVNRIMMLWYPFWKFCTSENFPPWIPKAVK